MNNININIIATDNNSSGGFAPRRIPLSKIEKAQGYLRRFEWHFSPDGEKKYSVGRAALDRAVEKRKRERGKPRYRG